MGKLMRPKEVAEELNIGVATVWKWIRSGELRAIPLSSDISRRKEYRVSPEDLEQFLEEKRKDINP